MVACTNCGEMRQRHANGVVCPGGGAYTFGLKAHLAEIESAEINSALHRTGGDVKAAAASLTMPRRTLVNKIAVYSVDVSGYRLQPKPDTLGDEIDNRIDAIGGGS